MFSIKITILIALSLAVFGMPMVAKAATIDQLIVKAKYGTTSDTVLQLQKQLAAKGFLANKADFLTGYYGEATKKAVLEYKAKNTKVTKKAAVSSVSVAPKKVVEQEIVKIAVNDSEEVTPSITACMQAIKKANAYCKSVAKGCNSESVLPRCLEANANCEVQQKAALELCPSTNQ